MDISNPRRILAVSLAECQDHLTTVLKELTGTYPESSAGNGALAGTTHELPLETPYYSARVPVWLDLIGVDERPEPVDDAPVPTPTAEVSKEDVVAAPDKNGEGEGEGEDDSTAATSSATPKQWADAFLAEEAREVRAVLGGVVVVLDIGNESSDLDGDKSLRGRAERQRDLVTQVGRLVSEGLGAGASNGDEEGEEGEEERDYYDDSWDGVGLVVGMASRSAGPPPSEDLLADWEDACTAAGLEFVMVAPNQPATNEFGEKTGIPRVLEALQANDWNQADGLAGNLGGESTDEDEFEDEDNFGMFQRPRRAAADGGDDDDDDNDDNDDDGAFDPESLDFGFDRSDFVGLREAIWQQANQTTADSLEEGGQSKNGDASGEEESVQAVERMMQKLLAVRELGEGLPPHQRRRLAARAVGEVMREL